MGKSPSKSNRQLEEAIIFLHEEGGYSPTDIFKLMKQDGLPHGMTYVQNVLNRHYAKRQQKLHKPQETWV